MAEVVRFVLGFKLEWAGKSWRVPGNEGRVCLRVVGGKDREKGCGDTTR